VNLSTENYQDSILILKWRALEVTTKQIFLLDGVWSTTGTLHFVDWILPKNVKYFHRVNSFYTRFSSSWQRLPKVRGSRSKGKWLQIEQQPRNLLLSLYKATTKSVCVACILVKPWSIWSHWALAHRYHNATNQWVVVPLSSGQIHWLLHCYHHLKQKPSVTQETKEKLNLYQSEIQTQYFPYSIRPKRQTSNSLGG
jgi:hypothetical protein